MIDVKVHISIPTDEDAVVISVVGYKQLEEGGEVKAFRGFPISSHQQVDDLTSPRAFVEDGWLWVPIYSGEILQPSIRFPGIWLNGFDQAVRAYTGVNEAKVAAAHAMTRRHEDQIEQIQHQISELRNWVDNVESMTQEALTVAKAANEGDTSL